MPRENPESSVQGDPLYIPKPSLWGGKETQNLAEAAGAAPSQHGVAGGLGERELPGSGAGQGEPCAQTLSSVWVWAARPIKHAIIHHGAEALRNDVPAEIPAQGWWSTEDVLCLVTADGQDMSGERFWYKPHLWLWWPKIVNNFWKMMFTCATELEETPFGAPSPFERCPWSKEMLCPKDFLFSQSFIFWSIRTSAGFLQGILVCLLWNSMGISVPAHPTEAC